MSRQETQRDISIGIEDQSEAFVPLLPVIIKQIRKILPDFLINCALIAIFEQGFHIPGVENFCWFDAYFFTRFIRNPGHLEIKPVTVCQGPNPVKITHALGAYQ